MKDQISLNQTRLAVERGELKKAARMLSKLDTASSSAEITLLRARYFRLCGEFDQGLFESDKALHQAPKNLPVWVELAILLRTANAGDKDLKTRMDQANVPKSLQTLLTMVFQGRPVPLPTPSGRAAKTVRLANAALAKGNGRSALEILGQPQPKEDPALKCLRAELALAQRRLQDANRFAQEVEQLSPLATDVLLLRARIAQAANQPGHVARYATSAADLAPHAVKAVHLAIKALLSIDAEKRARLVWDMASALNASLDKLALTEAQLLEAEGRFSTAASIAEKGVKTARDHVFVAKLYQDSNNFDSALTHYNKALEKEDHLKLRVDRAQLLQTLGRNDEADAELRRVLAVSQQDGIAALALAAGTKFPTADPLIEQFKTAAVAPETPENDRRLLNFALGKIMGDIGQTKDVFVYLDRANAATARTFPYDKKTDAADEAHLLGPVTEGVRRLKAQGTRHLAPIFVTGMPRSGTTLVEQILGAHPGVVAGGELGVISRVVPSLIEDMKEGEVLSTEDLTQAADMYADLARERLGNMPKRFTDKSIHSFAYIGLLQAVLPAARFVVVRRDPRDVALSIYRNHFKDGAHRYAADLTAIAQRIGFFYRMVSHWKKEQPESFYEVSYEALLAAPEAETRRLLAACDLPWDPACLEFHKSTSGVRTLSFAQVRQPLYASSKGGWRRYEAEMQPFVDALAQEGISLPD